MKEFNEKDFYYYAVKKNSVWHEQYWSGKAWVDDIEKVKIYKTLRGACNAIGTTKEWEQKHGFKFHCSLTPFIKRIVK